MSEPRTEVQDLLRRCVSCGLCLPHCATWAETGNEVHSPRGRLMLLQDLLDDDTPGRRQAYAAAFDLCIGCRACEAACPSGVPFSLLEHGSRLVAGAGSEAGRAPAFVLRHLDSRAVLRTLAVAGAGSRAILKTVLGEHWPRRLDERGGRIALWSGWLGTLPQGPGPDEKLRDLMDGLLQSRSHFRPPEGSRDAKAQDVTLFRGCANEGLLPDSSRRCEALLRACGCRVQTLPDQECCGALADHTGRPGRAAVLRRRNRQVLARRPDPAAPVVVEAAGCGHHLRNGEGQEYAAVVDAAVFLAGLPLPELRRLDLKVVYHDPCHARHGQGICLEPRRLLDSIPGLIRRETAEAEVCCGSGGAWGADHPELSRRLARRKARHLAETGADLVVTSNPGCLGQIRQGLALEAPRLPILPLTDLLWYAAFTRPA